MILKIAIETFQIGKSLIFLWTRSSCIVYHMFKTVCYITIYAVIKGSELLKTQNAKEYLLLINCFNKKYQIV